MAANIRTATKRTPLYREIAAKISRMIQQGSYRPGERLPSIRELSCRLRIGINTTTQAYALLENARIVEARPQSGYYVCQRSQTLEKRQGMLQAKTDISASSVCLGETHMQIISTIADKRLIPLGRGVPCIELLPIAKLNRMLATQGRLYPKDCISYSAANGSIRLRTQIAKRSLDYGCAFSPEQVIVTSGCMEAVALALLTICRAGDTVVVESPTNYTFLNFIQWMGLKVLEIPTSSKDGINLDVLSYAIQQNTIRACIVISNFTNPIGCLTPDAKKRELVRLLAKHDIALVEDDIYGDLGFGHNRPAAYKSHDENEHGFLCSSFSKTLAPGYRVGWIAPPTRYLEKIKDLKSLLNMATPSPTQLAVAEFLSNGGYDRHLRATRKILCERMTAMRESILRNFPFGTRVTTPDGGYLLWVEMPEEIDTFKLFQETLKEGISIAPGRLFSTNDRFKSCMRLNCSFWSERIEKVIQTIGRIAGRALLPNVR